MFYYRNRPILKTLGQFENLGFVIMSTRDNIAKAPLLNAVNVVNTQEIYDLFVLRSQLYVQ